MWFIIRLFHVLRRRVLSMSWPLLMGAVGLHALSTWLLLAPLAGETRLADLTNFVYWYVTTATTVGYGDLSPATDLGKWCTALWVMPGGIALFAGLIGKTTTGLMDFWRRGMRGQRSYAHLQDHIVLLGYHGESTHTMVELLRQDPATAGLPIVLCTCGAMENPLPDQVQFVCGESLTNLNLLRRAGVPRAGRLVVYGLNDDQTLATAMTIGALQPQGHVVVHFHDREHAALLKQHYPRIECTTNQTVEILVRAAQDPGSSAVVSELLSIQDGPTAFTLTLPPTMAETHFGALFHGLKDRHNITVFGFAENLHGQPPLLNPSLGTHVPGGSILFYMASARLDPNVVIWHEIHKEAA